MSNLSTALASMTPDSVFSLASTVALAGWVILVFLPRRFDLLFFIPQYFIPFGLGLVYAGLMFSNIYTIDGGFGSISEVRALFSNDAVLVAGWLHYLAFDLFIGAWIARRADALGLPRLIQAPILLATFMFGPVGLVLFLAIRAAYEKKPSANEQAS